MKHLRLLAALGLVQAGAALAADTSDISANGAAVVPSIGVIVDLAGDSALAQPSRTAHSVDMGFAYGKGKDKQKLEGGERPIFVGGETFAGPQDIRYDINVRFAHMAYRYRRYFGEREAFAVEGLVGLGWAGLGLRARGNTQTAAESLGNGGIVLGVGGIWRFREGTAMHVRLLGMGTGADGGVTSAGRFDLGVTQMLGRHASVSAGLTSLSVYSAREDRADANEEHKSPINAGVAGLNLGFNVIF